MHIFTAISRQADEALEAYRSQTGANNYFYVPFTIIILIAVCLITYYAFGVYHEEKITRR